MKHNIKVTLILLAMFFITQMIGLAVINAYTPKQEIIVNETTGQQEAINVSIPLPYGMQPPAEFKPEVSFSSIIISLLLATLLFFVLTKLRARLIIKTWFILVVFITLSIALTALLLIFFPSLNVILVTKYDISFSSASLIALILALPLTFYKIIRRNIIVHNFTELLIYPGLAAVFVPILNIPFTIALLIIIAVYDIYAVWHSKIMINMAKYQINNLKIFTGFFIPYITKKAMNEIKMLKKIKNLKLRVKKEKAKKIKISLAILGGGDVAFPLIFAGVVMRAHSFLNAFAVVTAATISVLLLFVLAKKEKFYPAMPFISTGCIIGYLLSLIV